MVSKSADGNGNVEVSKSADCAMEERTAASGCAANAHDDIDVSSCAVSFVAGGAGKPGHTRDHRCDPAVTLNGEDDRHNIIYYHVPSTMRYTFPAPVFSADGGAELAARVAIFVGDPNGHSRQMELRGDDGRVLASFALPGQSGWHTFPVVAHPTRFLDLHTSSCYPAYGDNWTYLYRVSFGQHTVAVPPAEAVAGAAGAGCGRGATAAVGASAAAAEGAAATATAGEAVAGAATGEQPPPPPPGSSSSSDDDDDA